MNISLNTNLTTERLKLWPVDLFGVDLVWEVSRFEGFTDGMTWEPQSSRQEVVEITHRNLGFWVHPDHWGNGYVSEAARAVLEFGFNMLHADYIVTAHATWNKRSRSVIQRLGFKSVGVNPAGFYKDGNPVEEVEYVVRRFI